MPFIRLGIVALCIAVLATGCETTQAQSHSIKTDKTVTGSIAPNGVDEQVLCLSDAIQYEARHTPRGAAAVATSIFARVRDGGFGGDSICEVTHAYRVRKGGRWSKFQHSRHPPRKAVPQFSYIMHRTEPWRANAAQRKLWRTFSLPIAQKLMRDFRNHTHTVAPKVQHRLRACDHFHDASVRPGWALRYCGKVDGLLFYASAD